MDSIIKYGAHLYRIQQVINVLEMYIFEQHLHQKVYKTIVAMTYYQKYLFHFFVKVLLCICLLFDNAWIPFIIFKFCSFVSFEKKQVGRTQRKKHIRSLTIDSWRSYWENTVGGRVMPLVVCNDIYVIWQREEQGKNLVIIAQKLNPCKGLQASTEFTSLFQNNRHKEDYQIVLLFCFLNTVLKRGRYLKEILP